MFLWWAPKILKTKNHSVYTNFLESSRELFFLSYDTSQEPNRNYSEKLVQVNFFILGGFLRVDFPPVRIYPCDFLCEKESTSFDRFKAYSRELRLSPKSVTQIDSRESVRYSICMNPLPAHLHKLVVNTSCFFAAKSCGKFGKNFAVFSEPQ